MEQYSSVTPPKSAAGETIGAAGVATPSTAAAAATTAAAAAARERKVSSCSENGAAEEEHDPMPDFKPIIPLPEEVEVHTGEEDEVRRLFFLVSSCSLECVSRKLFPVYVILWTTYSNSKILERFSFQFPAVVVPTD